MKFGRRLALTALFAFAGTTVVAQPSAADWIGGVIVKIDAERGIVRLRHEPIPYLHLPAGINDFRFVEWRVITGRRDGETVRFRADRVDLALRVNALVAVPVQR